MTFFFPPAIDAEMTLLGFIKFNLPLRSEAREPDGKHARRDVDAGNLLCYVRPKTDVNFTSQI